MPNMNAKNHANFQEASNQRLRKPLVCGRLAGIQTLIDPETVHLANTLEESHQIFKQDEFVEILPQDAFFSKLARQAIVKNLNFREVPVGLEKGR